MKFHSGKALTSADVKYSIEKVTAEDSQSARKSSFAVIADIADAGRHDRRLHAVERVDLVRLQPQLRLDHQRRGEDLTTSRGRHRPVHARRVEARLHAEPRPLDGYWGDAAEERRGRLPLLHRRDRAQQRAADQRSRHRHQRAEPRRARPVQRQRRLQGQRRQLHDQAAARLQRPGRAVRQRAGPQGGLLRHRQQEAARLDLGRLRHAHRLDGPADRPVVRGPHQGQPVRRRARQEAAGRGRLPDGFTFTLDTPNYDPHPTVGRVHQGASWPRSASP